MQSVRAILTQAAELRTVINPNHWRLLILLMKITRSSSEGYQNLHIFTTNISKENGSVASSFVKSAGLFLQVLSRAVEIQSNAQHAREENSIKFQLFKLLSLIKARVLALPRL